MSTNPVPYINDHPFYSKSANEYCAHCAAHKSLHVSLNTEDCINNYKVNSVDAPPHYTQGGIECIDAIKAALTPQEFRGYCKGNVLKYVWREKLKGKDEDLKKAAVYLKFAQTAGASTASDANGANGAG